MILAQLIQDYRDSQTEPPKREESRHARWWTERIGKEPVTALTTDRITEYIDRLGQYGRRPATGYKYLRFLRRVCEWGAACGYLTANPCNGISIPHGPALATRVLSSEEEQQLCGALGDPYRVWVRFALLTGFKQSEQFTLRWRDVDLTRKTCTLPHATTSALVSVALSDQVVAILQQLQRVHPPSAWIFPDLNNPYRPVNIHSFYTGKWVAAVHRAGIPWVAWKDLRTTCGIRLAQRGIHPTEIARILRHRETKATYWYRNWREEAPAKRPRVQLPKQPVFAPLSPQDFQAILQKEPDPTGITLGEVFRLYAERHLQNRPTRAQFDRIFRQYFVSLADRPLCSLKRREVLAWYAGLAKTPGQANKGLALLKAAVNWALDMELVAMANPCLRIKRYPEPPRERFLSTSEIQRFLIGLDHLSAKPRAFLLILLLTGARSSEARTMRWADLDLSTRLWRKSTTKTGRPHLVPLPQQAMDALLAVPRVNPWIFSGANGQPWCKASPAKIWTTVRRRWGLDSVTLHDLRRSCASHLTISGENLSTVQHVLNHSSLSQTARYARLNTSAVDHALQSQADRWLGVSISQGTVSKAALVAEVGS